MNQYDKFSEEAKKQLDILASEIRDSLAKEALNESLGSRGEPIEVTAADVRTAADRIIRRTSDEPLGIRVYFLFLRVLGAVLLLLIPIAVFMLESDEFVIAMLFLFGSFMLMMPQVAKKTKRIMRIQGKEKMQQNRTK